MKECNFFIKKLDHFFSPYEIELIFKNNVEYYNFSNNIAGLKIPRPISFDKKNIVFEYITGLERVLEKDYFLKGYLDVRLLEDIGEKLGKLHYMRGELKEKISLHGDFTLHNIAIKEDVVYFFDFEPPGIRRSFDDVFFNYNYVDVAAFVFSLLSCSSFFKPLSFFNNKKTMIESFLRGYSNGAAGFIFDYNILSGFLKSKLKDWFFDKREGYIKKNIKYIFLKVVIFFQIKIYKIFYD